MKQFITLTALVFGYILSSEAQQTFSAREFIDINNVRTSVMVHGDMNRHPTTYESECEFPKGSGKHVAGTTALWMAGYDQQGQLAVAAQTYRQTGNDYWPGPLTNGSIDYSTSEKWARVWKVSFFDINSHLANHTHNAGNTPSSILEWPAKGNPYAKGNNGVSLTIDRDMAPYIDVNSDGKYNALDGDYPEIKGDQMLWWIFNDNGSVHSVTFTEALRVEVHAKAYAYTRGTLIDNVVYYEMDIHNTNSMNLLTFRAGIFADMELGFFGDDYIGFDSVRRLGYVYNGKQIDGSGQPGAYGDAPPIAGYTLLEMPSENGSVQHPAGSFMTYYNDGSNIGNPQNGNEFNNYLRAALRNGTHIKNDFTGFGNISNGTGAGPDANYVFDGDPSDTAQWSECASKNPIGDRRFVLATGDHTFNSGTTAKLGFALVITDTGRYNTCDTINIDGIKDVTDTAWKYYFNPPKSFVSIDAITKGHALGIYPNPASDKLTIHMPFTVSSTYQLSVYDATGRRLNVSHGLSAGHIDMNITSLPPGLYHVIYSDGHTQQSGQFIKK